MKNKGITLIALVITIIVLIILAGVSIALTLNEGGLFEKATQAKMNQIKAEMRERLELALHEIQMEKLGSATLEDVTLDNIEDKLKEYDVSIKESENATKTVTMGKNGTNASYKIDGKLNITEDNDVMSENLKFKYEVQLTENNKTNVAITLQEKTIGISKIEFSDNSEVVELENTKEEKTIIHEMGINLECNVKITLATGENIEKNIKLNRTETVVDLQNAEYSGDVSYLQKTEDGLVINGPSGWAAIHVYMENLDLTQYDQIRATYSFDAGYDWSICASYLDSTFYSFDGSDKTGSGASVSQRTNIFNIPKDKGDSKLCFASSSLSAKLNIFDIILIKYE